jgi:uncharacterized protein YjbI with pentapeptide repeats
VSLIQIKSRAEGVKYEGDRFEVLDLRSMKAFGSVWTDCVFEDCQFDLADFRTAKFTNCVFRQCDMRLVNFSASFFENTKFVNCDLEQASFSGAHFHDGLFNECRLSYGEDMFLNATVKGKVEFYACNFHGSNLCFREVDPGAMKFLHCNFWGARIAMGCAFWTAHFDERTVKQFVALIARASQDEKLKDYAGDQYGVVARAMDGRKGQREMDDTMPVRILKKVGA